MAKKIAEGVALGLDYQVFDRSGIVSHSEIRSETEVEGNISGGGGYTSGGTGFNTPVSGHIRSKTTRFQNIFLTDDDGVEHTVELQDFTIPCKPDHRLSLLLLITGDNELGSYFSAYNHNTRTTHDNPKAVRTEMFPRKIFIISLAVVYTVAFFSRLGEPGTSFLGTLFVAALITAAIAILLYGLGATVGWYRSMLVRKNLAVRNHFTNIAAT